MGSRPFEVRKKRELLTTSQTNAKQLFTAPVIHRTLSFVWLGLRFILYIQEREAFEWHGSLSVCEQLTPARGRETTRPTETLWDLTIPGRSTICIDRLIANYVPILFDFLLAATFLRDESALDSALRQSEVTRTRSHSSSTTTSNDGGEARSRI